MKLGIFDSGLGGLVIAKAVRDAIPDIDMLYYGDTLHVPYGSRSQSAIYQYTLQAVKHMFEMDCGLIIVACNTASAAALRQIQQDYLPSSPYRDRRILGVVVPTLESALERGHKRFGLLATRYISGSGIYLEELQKINSDISLYTAGAPLLVPMIENGGMKWIKPVLIDYLEPLLEKDIDCLLLGCTHYPYLKDIIRDVIGDSIDILSQDETIPPKIAEYLSRHPEIDEKLERGGRSEFYASDITDSYLEAAERIYGMPVPFAKADSDGSSGFV